LAAFSKPLVENGVQQVERWVLAPLRHRTFFSLDELNVAIAEKFSELNNRPLSADSTQTRASLFTEHEKPKLKTLPNEPFEIGRWQRFKLGNDYHVRIDGVAYSVPFGLIGKQVDVHCTASLIGIFHQGERVASHPVSSGLNFFWHITTMSLLLQAIQFGIAATYLTKLSLAIVAAAYAGSVAVLGISMPPALTISYKTMPQGWFFCLLQC
jgi:hypothetical protein